MKISNLDLINSFSPAFNALMSKKISKAKVHYAITRTSKKVDEALADYNKARQGVIDNFVKKDKTGSPISVDNKYVFETEALEKEATEQVTILLSEVIELSIHSIDYTDLEDIDIEPIYITALRDFIKWPDEV